MALLHKATLTPSKLELLQSWLPGRPWAAAAGQVTQLGAYRFDDPAGEVGLETFLLLAADGTVLHVPLSYRGAELAGAERHLLGTLDHSVLGERWVYDGCADPVWVAAAATAALTGGSQAVEFVDGQAEPRQPSATVQGSGTPGASVPAVGDVVPRDGEAATVVEAGGVRLVVARRVGSEVAGIHTLVARWADGGSAAVVGVTAT